MKEKLVVVVMHPHRLVWDALCERTCELAPYLDHIESAELKSRDVTPQGIVRCEHIWRVRADLPAILAHHVNKGLLEWKCRTEWRVNKNESRWAITPQSMKDTFLCEGTMQLSSAAGGRGTRVDLDLSFGVFQQMAGLRSITGAMVSKHFRKLVEAAAQLIECK